MKTSELTGIPLCWFVAIAQGLAPRYERVQPWEGGKMGIHVDNMELYEGKWRRTDMGWHEYCPDKNWAQGGEIIEREEIGVIRCNDLYFPSGNEVGETFEQYWKATIEGSTDAGIPLYKEYGPTPLVAAMRCYVASELGDEVKLPGELK